MPAVLQAKPMTAASVQCHDSVDIILAILWFRNVCQNHACFEEHARACISRESSMKFPLPQGASLLSCTVVILLTSLFAGLLRVPVSE